MCFYTFGASAGLLPVADIVHFVVAVVGTVDNMRRCSFLKTKLTKNKNFKFANNKIM